MERGEAVKHMDRALFLARKAMDRTYPNPMVGCVIVSASGEVAGEGYHKRAGEPHAEVVAIRSAGRRCQGASMFVTLEPCDHHGKTPPCTRAIINSGISSVHVAVKDPNPINSGKGIRRLRESGIFVDTGIRKAEALRLNRKFFKFITSGMPYVTLKLAQSLDGKIAARDGSSKWISSPESRSYVKRIRRLFDGLIVGINTVIADDPLLLPSGKSGHDMARVVLDSKMRISAGSNIIKSARDFPVIIATTRLAPEDKIRTIGSKKGVEILVMRAVEDRVDIRVLLRELARRGMVNILVEGGSNIAGSMLDQGLIDEVMFFISPKILGGNMTSVKGRGVPNISEAIDIAKAEVTMSGKDVLVRGEIKRRRGKVCSRA